MLSAHPRCSMRVANIPAGTCVAEQQDMGKIRSPATQFMENTSKTSMVCGRLAVASSHCSVALGGCIRPPRRSEETGGASGPSSRAISAQRAHPGQKSWQEARARTAAIHAVGPRRRRSKRFRRTCVRARHGQPSPQEEISGPPLRRPGEHPAEQRPTRSTFSPDLCPRGRQRPWDRRRP